MKKRTEDKLATLNINMTAIAIDEPTIDRHHHFGLVVFNDCIVLTTPLLK
jgi:hypothetical protein